MYFPSHGLLGFSLACWKQRKTIKTSCFSSQPVVVSSYWDGCVVSCACAFLHMCDCIRVSSPLVSTLLLLLPAPHTTTKKWFWRGVLDTAGTMGSSLFPGAVSSGSLGGPQIGIYYFQVISTEIPSCGRSQHLQLHNSFSEEKQKFREGGEGQAEWMLRRGTKMQVDSFIRIVWVP